MTRWLENWLRRIVREEIAAEKKRSAEAAVESMRQATPHISRIVRESVMRALGLPPQ